MRLALPLIALVILSACGPKAEAPKPAADAAAPKADPAAELKAKMAAAKAEFDAVSQDEAKAGELADKGNPYALFYRAQKRLNSGDYSTEQAGFDDMDAAAKAGSADAQLWVGQKMAYGQDGFELKPASGLKMMEKAASQDNIDAILATALFYEQDSFMHDLAKAKQWYERGAALGSDKAKMALEKLGTGKD
ncbi:MAG TPA: hypothetical protein VG942_08145 [Hyphomonadaceae bacterium]|nr:hypothetical protein [Hyphomonadaceae bacterium]